jgi:hypothetical protein
MNGFNPASSPVFVALAVVVAALITIALRRAVRARASERRRVVEQPNSHYTSELVRKGEKRHRWQNIALDRIHEINRGEVTRLLAKVEASGVDSLREAERVFLDQVANVAPPRTPTTPRETGSTLASDLRHRPA